MKQLEEFEYGLFIKLFKIINNFDSYWWDCGIFLKFLYFSDT